MFKYLITIESKRREFKVVIYTGSEGYAVLESRQFFRKRFPLERILKLVCKEKCVYKRAIADVVLHGHPPRRPKKLRIRLRRKFRLRLV
jgi:hypothetical protein